MSSSPAAPRRETDLALPAPADKLRRFLPQWAFGLEEPTLARFLAGRALALGAERRDADLAACGAGLALWSWQRAPLGAAQCRLLAQVLPDSPAGRLAAALLPRLAPRPGRPDPKDAADLAATGDAALILRLLAPGLRSEEHSLAWLGPAWSGLLRLERGEVARSALDLCVFPPELLPLKARLGAEVEFLHGPPERALEAAAGLAGGPFDEFAAYLRAEALLRQGEAASGRVGLSRLFSRLPWHLHLGLKLHALGMPQALAGGARLSRAVVCIYSWNKAESLRRTLARLAETDLGGAFVLCLDNGSSDATPEVLREAAGLFPAGRFRMIRLPVNVGAPAARNWLLAQPEVRAAEFAAFLDDDALPPQRWLSRLLGALDARPAAGAAGCRIVSAAPPHLLQSADYQLFPPDGAAHTFRDLPENVNVFDNCGGAPDFGLFGYVRPAVHVSGCCHALRTDVVRGLGGFDIRLSPTQFDDLERDLRAAVAGRPAVYCGDLAVLHAQHSSLAKARGAAAMGQVLGNKIKLEGGFDRAEVAGAADRGLAALWADIAAKWTELAALAGPERGGAALHSAAGMVGRKI